MITIREGAKTKLDPPPTKKVERKKYLECPKKKPFLLNNISVLLPLVMNTGYNKIFIKKEEKIDFLFFSLSRK